MGTGRLERRSVGQLFRAGTGRKWVANGSEDTAPRPLVVERRGAEAL
jgi:hypothetical protein